MYAISDAKTLIKIAIWFSAEDPPAGNLAETAPAIMQGTKRIRYQFMKHNKFEGAMN